MELSTESGIYALYDSSGMRYIGQAKNLKKRVRQHFLLSQNGGNRKVNIWLWSLLKNNQVPLVKVLEYTLELNEREKYWIKYYAESKLLNMNDGGIDMSHANRAKVDYPWGKTHSPLQYRLKSIQETIRFFKRQGKLEKAARFEQLLIVLNVKIKRIGKGEINHLLWYKYGR